MLTLFLPFTIFETSEIIPTIPPFMDTFQYNTKLLLIEGQATYKYFFLIETYVYNFKAFLKHKENLVIKFAITADTSTSLKNL